MKVELPDAVGVPEIVPDEGVRASPAGRVPETTLHTYGCFPPEAPNEAT